MFSGPSPMLIAQARAMLSLPFPFTRTIILMNTPTIAQIKKLARRPSVTSLTKLQDIVRGQDKRLDLICERDFNYMFAGRTNRTERPKYLTAARDVSRKLALQPGGSRTIRRLAEREVTRMQRRVNDLEKRIGQVHDLPSKTSFALAT